MAIEFLRKFNESVSDGARFGTDWLPHEVRIEAGCHFKRLKIGQDGLNGRRAESVLQHHLVLFFASK